jgi:beta-lactamase class A
MIRFLNAARWPSLLHLLAALAVVLMLHPSAARAQDTAQQALADTIATLESDLDARIGVFIRDTGTGWDWRHRESERFLMASTFKSLLCGAVLEQLDRGALSLDERLAIRPGEIHGHAPVTRDRAGQTLPVEELCLATLDLSDNGAANLLVDRLGGPAEVTAFLRQIGDTTTRLDRKEPDLNLFVPGDPRDTTSPLAMVSSWQVLLLGDALQAGSRARLARWMGFGGVTGDLIRPHVPQGWAVSDKSGGGRDHTRNIVAMVTPPGQAPYLVAIYLSDTPANWKTRNAAVSALGAAVIRVIEARLP